MTKLRAVLAGLGGFGRRWFDVCGRNGDVDLVGFVARSAASRERAAAEWGAPRELLYVTPPSAHRHVAQAAFAAGVAAPVRRASRGPSSRAARSESRGSSTSRSSSRGPTSPVLTT